MFNFQNAILEVLENFEGHFDVRSTFYLHFSETIIQMITLTQYFDGN